MTYTDMTKYTQVVATTYLMAGKDRCGVGNNDQCYHTQPIKEGGEHPPPHLPPQRKKKKKTSDVQSLQSQYVSATSLAPS